MRRTRGITALAWLVGSGCLPAGCLYSPGSRVGAPCDGDDVCVDGNVCDLVLGECVPPEMASMGEDGAESGTMGTTTGDGDGDGDGDPTTTGDGDGDGDPTTTGDGDGDPTTTGDGDGDGDPTTTGDGDGDGDPTTTGDGDGDGDPTTTGDGDGDGDPTTTGDGDGDGDPTTTGDGDGDGDPTTTGDGDGDGDPTTTGDGDGDGDPTTTGDGDGDGDGDVCGDGNVTGPEACDDGVNDGSYGGCNADCLAFGPYCGDGVEDSPQEVCDDGVNDGSYGGCSADCTALGPYCGDGVQDSPQEACDDGTNDGSYNGCSADCTALGPYCGDGTIDVGEFCEIGGSNLSCTECFVEQVWHGYEFVGENPGDGSGRSVAYVPDLDGDTFPEILIGAYGHGIFAGKTYLYLSSTVMGNPAGTLFDLGAADFLFVGELAGDYSGWSVAAGDIDGDGLGDVVIGAPYSDNTDAGKTYIFLGKTIEMAPQGSSFFLFAADHILTGAASGDRSGYAVAVAGDVDGDLKDDLLIGAPFNDEGFDGNTGTEDEGMAYLMLGGPLTAGGAPQMVSLSDADYEFPGEAAGDNLGIHVSTAGRVDSDATDDLLLAAYHHDGGVGAATGKTYLFFSATVTAAAAGTQFSVGSEADRAFLGATSGEQSGAAIAAAGDVDGDGHGDLLIGANTNSEGGTDAGKTYLMTSETIMAAPAGTTFDLGASDYAFVGELVGDWSGRGVAPGGDVDGDGRSDVFLGAPRSDNNGGTSDEGSSYLIFGSTLAGVTKGTPAATLPLSSADAAFYGDWQSGEAGFGVTAHGDVSGDGKDDLLIGAQGDDRGKDDDPNTLDEGRTYLILSPY